MDSVVTEIRPAWKERLSPLEEAYSAAYTAIVHHVESLDDDQRRQFMDDLTRPGQTNCSWMLYEAAQLATMALGGDERRAVHARRREAGNEWR